jgi:hypothetical protein
MNNGLSEELKSSFAPQEIVPVKRPEVENILVSDPNWLAGFTSAEGCFRIRINKAGTKTGEAVKLVFQLTQHVRDEQLMKSFINYFDCGNVHKNKESFVYEVGKFSDILTKILPFFYKYPIIGVKNLDYIDFISAAELIKNKDHLSPEGLDNIKKLKAGMNKERSLKAKNKILANS